jgi:hypothetical protein
MSRTALIIIVLLVLCFAGAPAWGYHNYGWYPSGGVGLVVLVLVILLLLGKI